jgi:hypothetical protein
VAWELGIKRRQHQAAAGLPSCQWVHAAVPLGRLGRSPGSGPRCRCVARLVVVCFRILLPYLVWLQLRLIPSSLHWQVLRAVAQPWASSVLIRLCFRSSVLTARAQEAALSLSFV